jgi:hypothetical protein
MICSLASSCSQSELGAVLGWHANYEAAYRKFGAVIIDAALPPDQVVDECVSYWD